MIQDFPLIQEEYEDWKEAHKPGESLGLSWNCQNCPLASFLNWRYPGTLFEVDYQFPKNLEYVTNRCQMEGIESYYEKQGTLEAANERAALPAWAREELLSIDFLPDGLARRFDVSIVKE